MTSTMLPARRNRHDDIPGFRLLQTIGFVTFTALSASLAVEIGQGATRVGYVWLLPIVAVVAYVAADFVSGFVHFLADNFGTRETPFFGPAFVEPFREHHVNPKGITEHPFMVANGNNCLVSVPPLAIALFALDVDDSLSGYVIGAFVLMFSLAILLTNQFHKWAHLDDVPRWVAWLQAHNIVLPKDHHDIHHLSPFDTHYCITVGWCNPLLQRVRFFERTESLIRRCFPGSAGAKPEAVGGVQTRNVNGFRRISQAG